MDCSRHTLIGLICSQCRIQRDELKCLTAKLAICMQFLVKGLNFWKIFLFNLSNEFLRLITFIKHVVDLKQIKVFPVDIKIRLYVPNSVGLVWTRWCVSKDVNDHKRDRVHGHSVTMILAWQSSWVTSWSWTSWSPTIIMSLPWWGILYLSWLFCSWKVQFGG